MLSQEKTNKILAMLTIVFTLSIPATVIGTFYGMNINLPGEIVMGSDSAWALYFFNIYFGNFIGFCPPYGIIFQKAWMARIINIADTYFTIGVYLTG
jgi:Mg2+ and Co2+ transporter CorA